MLKVYGAQWCSFCKKAKDFLDTNNIQFEFVDIDQQIQKSTLLLDMNLKTIPQVFNGDEHIGGYTDLVEYVQSTSTP